MKELHIIWTLEDVKQLRPRWSIQQCEKALDYIDADNRLEEASIDAGWAVMEDVLPASFKDMGKTRFELTPAS